MESALRLSYGTPLSMPLRVPSTVTTAQATRVQFNSRHSSLSLSTGSTSRPIGHPFTPVTNAFDRSSVPSVNKGAHKIVRGTVGVSRDLAYGFGVNGSTSRVNRKAVIKASTEPTDGETGLKLLFDATKCLASSTEQPSKVEVLFDVLKSLASNRTHPSKEDVFKMKVDWKMKSVKADEELKKLQEEVDKERKNDPLSADTMEMALVKLLICLGKFKEASDCHCIKTEPQAPPSSSQICLDEGKQEEASECKTNNGLPNLPSNTQLFLYKAIIYTKINEKAKAEKWWDRYVHDVQLAFDCHNKH